MCLEKNFLESVLTYTNEIIGLCKDNKNTIHSIPSCLNGVGKIEEAREMFTEALRGIETEISEAEVLRDGIKEKLK